MLLSRSGRIVSIAAKGHLDTLRLTDVPLVDVGICIWSLTGTGVGERVRISRLSAYERVMHDKRYSKVLREDHEERRRLYGNQKP